MQTTESLRYGLKFASVLGGIKESYFDAPEAEDTAEIVERGNPWRDEFGKFTDEANAAFNVAAQLSREVLEGKANAYEKASIGAGRQKGFLFYSPKADHAGNEPPKWHKMNRAIGKAEGIANSYTSKARAMKEPTTEEGKKIKMFWLSNAAALRDVSRLITEKRDRIKVRKEVDLPTFAVIKEIVSGAPDFIAEAFLDIDQIAGADGDPGEFDAVQSHRIKKFVVNNAVGVGLLTREEADKITARIKG